RATAVLATLFVLLSIVLAALAVDVTGGREIDTTLQRGAAPVQQPAPVDPLAGNAAGNAAPASGEAAPAAAPAPAQPADPLAGQ
ncbi:MAG: preprotein translocase subunit SecG, partial [Sphingomonadales bacterium]